MNKSNKRNLSLTTFVTRLGRHTPTSLGRDLGVGSFSKVMKTNTLDGLNKFTQASEFLKNFQRVGEGIHLLNKLHSGLVENGHESASNGEQSKIPFTSESEQSSLGKNDAVYYKTHAHIGKPTGSRIKNIQSGPYIETITRLTASSYEDYLTHHQREKLNFKSGFNEKGFSFLMEDTYFSIKDFYNLFKIEKNYKKEFESSDEGKKDIYGCILNTKHKFKLKNRADFYSIHVKFHLIKIMDVETDVRELIKDITHNSESDSLDKAGKIPLNQQYKDPNLNNKENKLSINLITSLNCNLNLSTRFRERAKIVKSWSRTLPPSSIWEFNLTHHYGRGIHLNRIYDIHKRKEKSKNKSINELEKVNSFLTENKNETTIKTLKENIGKEIADAINKKKISEHPVGYIFCLEYVGDRRGSIINKSKDFFSGYSPCHFNMEFSTEFTVLSDSEEEKEDKFLIYKKSRQEKNFHEDSEFPDIFYPERQPFFHVNFDKIGDGKPYQLTYDQSVKSSGDFSNIINMLSTKLEEYGINIGGLNADDLNFKFTKDPNEEPNDKTYEGTEGNDGEI